MNNEMSLGGQMREIKFRAWDGHLMHSVDELHFCQGGLKWYGPGVGSGWAKDTSVMQFTGLKDRNGREIYEGDILQAGPSGRLYPVEWRVSFASFWAKTRLVYLDPLRWAESDVIGNIYENPELLEVK